MATGIFCTVAEVQHKAGANASAVANTETYIDDYTTQAESQINAESLYNWSDKYGTLDVDVKGLLKLAASNLAAMYVIQYDMTGSALREFETRLDVLYDGYKMAIKLLSKKANAQDFMIGA